MNVPLIQIGIREKAGEKRLREQQEQERPASKQQEQQMPQPQVQQKRQEMPPQWVITEPALIEGVERTEAVMVHP